MRKKHILSLALSLGLFAAGANAANENDHLPLGRYKAEISKISTASESDCLKGFAQSFNEGLSVLDLQKEPVKISDKASSPELSKDGARLNAEDLAETSTLKPLIEVTCEPKRTGELPANFEEMTKQLSENKDGDLLVEITDEQISIADALGSRSYRYTETLATERATLFLLTDGGKASLEKQKEGFLLKIKGFEYLLRAF